MKRTAMKSERVQHLAPRIAAVAAVALSLGACTMNAQVNPMEGIGFREARFQEVSAMREFRACRDEALQLDALARSSGETSRYLASARLLEKCEADLGPEVSQVGRQERVQAYALSIQNFVKGGDVEAAWSNLDRFKSAYPNVDIYYTDGSSFIATMETLLSRKPISEFGRYAALNVSSELKSEMRRVRHWKRN